MHDSQNQVESLPLSKYWKIKIFGPLVLAIIFVNFVLPAKEYTLLEQARNATLAGNHVHAKHVYDEMLLADPNNIEFHRNKIKSHFNSAIEEHNEIKNFYTRLSASDDKTKSDIGFYGLGFIEVINQNQDGALYSYLKIDNTNLPFINNSTGFIRFKQKKYKEAEEYFLNEIRLNGNLKGAYSNLSKVYYETNNMSKLENLLIDEVTAGYITNRFKRHHYLKTGQYKEYLTVGFKLGNFTKLGLLGAILILSIWLVFLRKIDIFEPERPQHILIVLLMGCLFSMLATPMYDTFAVHFGFEFTGNYINDLLFCIFGIGLIEETVKIIPFLIILRFKKIVNESVDYIIYASVSALGFAFMENLIYFHSGGLDNMVSRMLSSVVLHMALTSFIAFGLLYADYKEKGSRLRCFVIAFLISCILHGIYDFFILSGGWVEDFKMVSTLILTLAIGSYSVIISNALNLSEFISERVEAIKTLEFLIASIMTIVIYQYLVIANEYGIKNGNISLLEVILFSIFLVMINLCLGYFQISKLSWNNLGGFLPDKNK